MAAAVEFGLLGPLTVRCGPDPVAVGPGKQRAVLASLLLNTGHVVSLDDLAEVVWGPELPATARVGVQNYVMKLRKALSVPCGELIFTRPGGYLIPAGAGVLDVAQFEGRLKGALMAAREKLWDRADDDARSALSLWRGEPLLDVSSQVLAQREGPWLAELRMQALETRISADLHRGRHTDVIGELRHLAGDHPLREQLHALLMLALYRDGRQGEALAAYQGARRVLVDELGTEPGPHLRGLHRQILAGDPGLAGPPRVGAASLRPPPSRAIPAVTSAAGQPASPAGPCAGRGCGCRWRLSWLVWPPP